MSTKKVSVIGLGYVGLPLMVAIAKSQLYEVVGFNQSARKVEQINAGVSPIEDPSVTSYLKQNRLSISSSMNILKGSNIFLICVPTPVKADFQPDYSHVIAAAETVAKYLKPGNHVVLESTVNPGTSREIILPVLETVSGLKGGKDFNLSHCPERINPGDSKWNVTTINRNIGSMSRKFNHEVAEFYRSFMTSAIINEVSSLEIAEATKIIENTFRDINIAFVNELAKSFDAMGLDLQESITAAANKPFGFLPHYPGIGVGGHCIAVDPYYLIKRAAESGFDHKFIKLAREINNSMPLYAVEKLSHLLNEVKLPINGTKVALLGLSYKPNIGDTRESPALELQTLLEERKAIVVAYDPYVDTSKGPLEKLLQSVDAVVIATAHQEFIEKVPLILQHSEVKVVLDGRNCLNESSLQETTVLYSGIGK